MALLGLGDDFGTQAGRGMMPCSLCISCGAHGYHFGDRHVCEAQIG